MANYESGMPLTDGDIARVFDDPYWDEAWRNSANVLPVLDEIEQELSVRGEFFEPDDPARV